MLNQHRLYRSYATSSDLLLRQLQSGRSTSFAGPFDMLRLLACALLPLLSGALVLPGSAVATRQHARHASPSLGLMDGLMKKFDPEGAAGKNTLMSDLKSEDGSSAAIKAQANREKARAERMESGQKDFASDIKEVAKNPTKAFSNPFEGMPLPFFGKVGGDK